MRREATGFVVGLLGLLLFAAPAAAHGGDPVFSVEQSHPSDTSVHYIISMVWEDDGDPIDGKTVTATPTAPDGTAGAAVTLTGSGNGRYEGTVEMPTAGSWTVTFGSADPEGSYAYTEVRPEPAAVTTTASTTGPDEPDTEEAVADQDESADAAAPASDDGDDDSGLPVLILVGALVVALGGGFAAIRIVRQNSAPKNARE